MSSRTTQAGTTKSRWSPRSHVSTFIKSLHLLDLPLLEDWPGLTEQTFNTKSAQQTLQHRTKAVEWSLYRLFELYDPDETKDKLRPFFPPVAPLQSLNLRAALYRCLTELKKNGVLGREILLRKTMLDECKGDKFEETIAAFSMIVLRKTVGHKTGSVATRYNQQRSGEQIIPLLLAHRISLQRDLEVRRRLRQEHEAALEKIINAEQQLQQRRIRLESKRSHVDPTEESEVKVLVNTNWVGERGWVHVLLHGCASEPVFRDSALIDSTSLEAPDAITSEKDHGEHLVSNLAATIEKHESRLAEWKVIAKDLRRMQSKSKVSAPTIPTNQSRPAGTRFTRHRTLQISNQSEYMPVKSILTPQHQKLLTAMRDELKRGQSANARRAPPERTPIQSQAQMVDSRGSGPEDSLEVPETQRTDFLETPHDHEPTVNNELTTTARVSPAPSSVSSVDENPHDSTWTADLQTSTMPTDDTLRDSPVEGNLPSVDETNIEPMQTPSSPTKEWMSLMDRTRASMSMFGNYKHPLDSDPLEDKTDNGNLSTLDEGSSFSSTPPRMDDENRRSTLLERTRQSMSLISHPKPRARKSHIEKRISQVYPINQFETPGRKLSSKHVEWSSDSQSSTPRDKLFEESADYASVFKSRPKIALSPTMSPERSAVGFDSILEHEMEDLDLSSGDE